jgi:AAA ATPase domain
MFAIAHSEVLAGEWLAPVPLGREREVDDLVRRLDPPAPAAPPPWIAVVAGPSGSGTSTVARRAAREVADRIRASAPGSLPRVLSARVAGLRGTHGVATALLQRFDPGFDGRGFPVAEIVAGILRRIRRDARPTILVLDDVEVGGPALGPIVRACAEPDRFLPEGESGLPPLWTIVAGSVEGLATALEGTEPRIPLGPFLELRPYPEPALRAIVRDRAERALGRAPPPSLVSAVVERSIEDGGGSRRAVDLLRRELLGGRARPRGAGREAGPEGRVPIEPRVVRAIGGASGGVAARLGEVRRLEARLALEEGNRPLPATTLWRRIVRLERAGYVRREIRTGGEGGTSSVVRVLTPIDEWVTTRDWAGTRRDAGH